MPVENLRAHIMMITYQEQFTCSHVLCYICDCLIGQQSVCVNTPPGWRHSCSHTPRINQPSPMRTLSPTHQILSTTVQSSKRLRRYFPRHGTSFPGSTLHIHVNVARLPSLSSRAPLAQAWQHSNQLLPSCRVQKTSFPSLQYSATCRPC